MSENEEAASRLDPSRRPTRSKTACRLHSTAPPNRSAIPVLVDRELAVGRLARWASRGAA